MDPTDISALHALGVPTVSPDGRTAVVAVTRPDLEADEYLSQLWVVDTSGDEVPRQLTHGRKDSAPRYSPDGRWLVVGCRSGQVCRWDLSQEKPAAATWAGHRKEVTGVAFDPDGAFFFTSAADGTVKPSNRGMSVAPSLAALPQALVPERLRGIRPGARGSDRLKVFRLETVALQSAGISDFLELVPTSSKHGVVQPSRPMLVIEYQGHLAATRPFWTVDEA